MTDELDPTPLQSHEDQPMWESDADERDAKRRKMLVFGGSAVGVLVGFVALYGVLSWIAGSLTSDPTDDTFPPSTLAREADPAEPPPVAPGADISAAADLDWFAIEAPLGHSQRLFTSESGLFYALSTVPGNAFNWPVPKAIYKSGDGENWDMIQLDTTISANDMALSSKGLYLIGTAPGLGNFGDPPQVAVNTSADEGTTWTPTVLPTVAAPPNGAPIEWSNLSTKIAANDSTVIAAVHTSFFLDYRQIVPNEFVGDMMDYVPSSDGVTVINYEIMERMHGSCELEMEAAGGDFEQVSDECQQLFEGDDSAGEIGFVTWEEMGLPDGGQPLFSELFISADGANFEAVESPFVSGFDVSDLFAIPDGFIAVEHGRGGAHVWNSNDGRDWVQLEGLPMLDRVTNVGSINGRTVIVGQGRDQSFIVWENDAGDWDTVDFESVLGANRNGGRWLSSAAIGQMGVVAVFQSFDELAEREFTEAAIGTSPQDWSVVPLEDITGMSGGYSSWAAVGTDQILIQYQVHTRARPLTLQVMGVRTN